MNIEEAIDIWCMETANGVFYANRPSAAEALMAALVDDGDPP